MENDTKKLVLPDVITVKELAEVSHMSVPALISKLLSEGILATINDTLDYNTAAVIMSDLGHEVEAAKHEEVDEEAADDFEGEEQEVIERAPVITVMGHVDHGKTSLLDKIRDANVAGGEAGGITQHIGAYKIEHNGRAITFLDTPGHEAFSAIRAQGAKVTDIIVLVVAADDGVKPQTEEAISLAKAAEVPVVVAMTKVDKPEANTMKVMQELSKYDLAPEEWGGKIPFVSVSSKTGEGIDDLLEMILLTADIQELKARSEGRARGVVIESQMDPKVGPTATVLIQEGELKVGDPIWLDSIYGKVKQILSDQGKKLKHAGPSTPVRVMGFSAQPQAGQILRVARTEKESKLKASDALKSSSARKKVVTVRGEMRDISEQIKQSHQTDIHLVVKADTFGSLEAIHQQLEKIHSDKGSIRIVSSGLGNINESDVLTATGGGAFIVGFKVGVSLPARRVADKEKVQIMLYDIIYQLTDDLAKLLLESIGSERIERQVGSGEVLMVFRDDPEEKIVGIKLLQGRAHVGNFVDITREEESLGRAQLASIKQVTESIKFAEAPGEFGIQIKFKDKLKPGDVVEFIEEEVKEAVLQ